MIFSLMPKQTLYLDIYIQSGTYFSVSTRTTAVAISSTLYITCNIVYDLLPVRNAEAVVARALYISALLHTMSHVQGNV